MRQYTLLMKSSETIQKIMEKTLMNEEGFYEIIEIIRIVDDNKKLS